MNWYKLAMEEATKKELVKLIDRFVDVGGVINETTMKDGTKSVETGLGDIWDYTSTPEELIEALKNHLKRADFLRAVLNAKEETVA